MSDIGKPERQTQQRVIQLFQNDLGYQYLGDWTDRAGNSNIEDGLLTAFLQASGYNTAQASRVLEALHREADNPNRSLMANNQAVYKLLRYGVAIKVAVGEMTETVPLIHWYKPEANHFAIAEEVTLKGGHERRPDLVLYVNGIAIGVLELKNSRRGIGEGIRQSLSNQTPDFNAWFFSTVQFVFAGNDTEGLQYGCIGTQEKFFLKWKEDEAGNTSFKLDKYLHKMCTKARLLELMFDFVLFDGGVKKLPRVHQYFGIKAAQDHVRERKGGIIRQTESKPLLDALHQWMLLQRHRITDGTATAKALDYSLKRWVALSRFAQDARLPIDNNWAENQIRPIAIGRNNWLFAGSLRAGQRAAAVMSLIQSAKLNGHDPYAYLKAMSPLNVEFKLPEA